MEPNSEPLQYPVSVFKNDEHMAHAVTDKLSGFSGFVKGITFVLNDRTRESVRWSFWMEQGITVHYARLQRSILYPRYNTGEMSVQDYQKLTFPAET